MDISIKIDDRYGDYYKNESEEEESNYSEENEENDDVGPSGRKGIPGVRLPDEIKFPRESTNPAPTGYISIQNRINSRNGKIDPGEFNQHLRQMVKDGWMELNDVDDTDLYVNPGMRIRYTTKKGQFRTGGFYIKTKEEDNDKYIVYKAHNNTVWSLQYDDIDRIFCIHGNKRRKKKEMEEEKTKYDSDGLAIKPVKFKRPDTITDFPVMLKRNGVYKIIYYTRDNYTAERFKSTKKYQRALKYGWSFLDEE